MAKKPKSRPKGTGPVVKPRDLNVVAMLKLKKGSHGDRRKKVSQQACRKPVKDTE